MTPSMHCAKTQTKRSVSKEEVHDIFLACVISKQALKAFGNLLSDAIEVLNDGTENVKALLVAVNAATFRMS